MLYCAVLYCIVLLGYVGLCGVMSGYVGLCWVMLGLGVVRKMGAHSPLYCFAPCCGVLYCTVLYCAVMHCNVM